MRWCGRAGPSGVDLDDRQAASSRPSSAIIRTGPKIVFPASTGARNWHPAAFDPTRRLYFASVVDMGNLMFIPPGQENPPHKPRNLNAVGGADLHRPTCRPRCRRCRRRCRPRSSSCRSGSGCKDKPFSSELRAIDPLTGKTKWAVDRRRLAGSRRRARDPVRPRHLRHGLGQADRARCRDRRKCSPRSRPASSMLAAPMTYRVDGVQYVAVQAGWGGGGWGFVPGYAATYARATPTACWCSRSAAARCRSRPTCPRWNPRPSRPRSCPASRRR